MEELIKMITPERFWIVFGFAGQAVFGTAFLVQWVASEKLKRSHIPISFWYLRIIGSMMLLTFAVAAWEDSPKMVVLVFGFSLNCLIYVRNLVLIYRRRAFAGTGGEEAEKWDGC